MAGFADLLGTLVQSGLAQSSSKRTGNMFGAGGGSSLNDIVGSLSNILGGGKGSTQSAGFGGVLGDIVSNLGDNKAVLGGIGALGGALLGGNRGSAKGAINGGVLAMLAGLAVSALKNAGKTPAQTPPALMASGTSYEQELEADAEILVKAMINAAKADGTIDRKEQHKILGKIEEGGITQREKELFLSEIEKPIDLEGVVYSGKSREDLGAQIYAASLLAIEVDSSEEQRYMQALASGLGLDQQTVDYINRSLGLTVA